jgi:hypothetical protein
LGSRDLEGEAPEGLPFVLLTISVSLSATPYFEQTTYAVIVLVPAKVTCQPPGVSPVVTMAPPDVVGAEVCRTSPALLVPPPPIAT